MDNNGHHGGVKDQKVLIIEDDADLVELFSMALALEGYSVDGATTLAAARQLVAARHYPVIFCDMQIGNERSVDFLREVNPGLDGAQVVMISGTGQYQTMAEDLGADFFLVKPIDLDVLIALVGRLMRTGCSA
jgi:two-component system response regulator PilR (NtrC family)